MPPKVALVYDRVNSWGGAERVLLKLHEIFPEAPLFTSVYDQRSAPWARVFSVRTSWLQRIPWVHTRHQLVGWLMPFVFETLDFSGYDIVISVTSEFAKAVITRPEQLHICYLLTPTRYLWSHHDEYLQTVPSIFQPIARWIMQCLRGYDQVVAQRPDVLVPISHLVAKRAEQYYGRSADTVIYPPLSELAVPEKPPYELPRRYLVAWGRLVAYKQFDRIVRAAHAARLPIVIVGSGPQEQKLRHLAQQLDPSEKKISVLPALSESQLHWCLDHAAAAVFPQLEDYGISIMEARLSGCPVVVHPDSGAVEQLKNELGVFPVRDESQEALTAALRAAWAFSGDRLDIARRARQYAGVRFATAWQAFLRKKKPESKRKEL